MYYHSTTLPKVKAAVLQFPFTNGFVSALTLSHKVRIAVCPEDAIDTYPGAPDCSTMRTWDFSQIMVFQLAMYHGPVMLYILLITTMMTVINFKVSRIEIKSSRYGAASAGAEQNVKRTKNVLWQGILYAGGFFMNATRSLFLVRSLWRRLASCCGHC